LNPPQNEPALPVSLLLVWSQLTPLAQSLEATHACPIVHGRHTPPTQNPDRHHPCSETVQLAPGTPLQLPEKQWALLEQSLAPVQLVPSGIGTQIPADGQVALPAQSAALAHPFPSADGAHVPPVQFPERHHCPLAQSLPEGPKQRPFLQIALPAQSVMLVQAPPGATRALVSTLEPVVPVGPVEPEGLVAALPVPVPVDPVPVEPVDPVGSVPVPVGPVHVPDEQVALPAQSDDAVQFPPSAARAHTLFVQFPEEHIASLEQTAPIPPMHLPQ